MASKISLRQNQRGSTVVEYALIVGLIIGAVLAALTTWSVEINKIYAIIVDGLTVTLPGGT